MSCEICRRGNCTKSFHSLEEQEQFNDVADGIKERARNVISHRINKIEGHYHDSNYYVNVEEVIKMIDDFV